MPKKKRVVRYKRYPIRKSTRDYDDPKYTEFRKAVLNRDGRKCQSPTCRSGKCLHVHHIRTWASSPYLRYTVANGITLCKACHKLITGKEEFFALMFHQIAYRNAQNAISRNNRHKRKG